LERRRSLSLNFSGPGRRLAEVFDIYAVKSGNHQIKQDVRLGVVIEYVRLGLRLRLGLGFGFWVVLWAFDGGSRRTWDLLGLNSFSLNGDARDNSLNERSGSDGSHDGKSSRKRTGSRQFRERGYTGGERVEFADGGTFNSVLAPRLAKGEIAGGGKGTAAKRSAMEAMRAGFVCKGIDGMKDLDHIGKNKRM
jgi:hypothetical protein